MSRWQPHARERLERAALELFEEQGFTPTTVPQIAARAGLTTRTFFRHFADKREALFGNAEASSEQLERHLMEAPATLSAAALILHGLEHTTRYHFEGRKDDLRRRSAIIQSDTGLLERNLQKRAAVRDTFARELTRRGHDTAALHAEIGVLALFTAIEQWLGEDDDRTLFDCVLESLESLRGVVADYSPEPGS
ncbi:TetR family transcriptional regulator [Saccharopolyspora terrae]|uniref:TetR family transcriptional regulator n=1 Tax=Saccharopolyspora terrae TaxID=2530384 RepID=A0A4R4VCS8_9PSEU|nr:TetR/AcrR family transcriptional regulator [Saccharopolyspora terrae]TDC99744.1 TetR family transcriptional regulator [Saccharopolyspora terrae]